MEQSRKTEEILALLRRHGFHFSKSMGQNFLIDPAIPRAIAEASGAEKTHGVLEVGPGIGVLSAPLCELAGRVVSVELDRTLAPVLHETMERFENFDLVFADIMKLDIKALAAEKFAGLRPIVCANLPYNITTPVLTAFLRAGCFESMTVLIQKEVAQRICAKPGTAEYGAFSVFMQYFTEPEILFDVAPDSFYPAPKVTSSVLRARVRSVPPVTVADEDFFFRVVYAAFSLRRKTLSNALSASLRPAIAKETIVSCIERCGLSPDIRGERLDIATFAKLSALLREYLPREE